MRCGYGQHINAARPAADKAEGVDVELAESPLWRLGLIRAGTASRS